MITYPISSNLCKKFLCNVISFRIFHLSEAATKRCSVRKVVLRNFAKFTGKHLWQSLFFNKVAQRATASDLSRVFS